MSTAKDEPALYGEAESFLDGEPDRFARQNLRSSVTGLRDLSTAEPLLPTQGASRE
jgi:hypothetical protein